MTAFEALTCCPIFDTVRDKVKEAGLRKMKDNKS